MVHWQPGVCVSSTIYHGKKAMGVGGGGHMIGISSIMHGVEFVETERNFFPSPTIIIEPEVLQ